MADDIEKTEPPTPKRRTEAREKGEVATSKELFAVANLLSVVLALMSLGAGVIQQGMVTFHVLWQPRRDIDMQGAMDALRLAFGTGAQVILPVLGAVFAGVVLVGLIQTRGNVSFYPLKPKMSAMNPLTNVKQLVQTRAIADLAKSVLKVLLVGGTVYYVITRNISNYPGLSRLPLILILEFQLSVVFKVFLAAILVLSFIALADYGWEYYQMEKGLKMSKQEIKDEHKQQEGDQHVKSRLRSLQLERSRTRMMEQIPKADVVVTNPQHLAIALRYDRSDMAAPTVTAKGAGFLAARIREIARNSGVPLVENKPLAQTLYRSVKVGHVIPERLFLVVAEVLAHVYRLDRRKAAAWR